MSIPEGFKLVPAEPTCSMVLAGQKALGGCVGSCGEASPPDGSDIADAFLAMLAAAPTPPQNIYDEAKRIAELEQALAGMLFAFDDGVGRDWSEDLLDFARKLTQAVEFQSRAKSVEVDND